MKTGFRVIVAFAFLGLLSATAKAATPASDKSIRELMTLTGAANIGVQMMESMLPELKKLVPQVRESFWTEFMQGVDPDEMVNLVVPIYQKHFSEEEIQETIRFYRSPTGKKVIQALPQVMQESVAAGQKWGQQLARQVVEKAQKAQSNSP